MTQPIYTGLAVTPFIGAQPAGTTNPFPVSLVTPAVQFAAIAPGLAAGDTLVVAPSVGNKIRVIGFVLDTGAVVTDCFFKSGTGPGTRISATGTGITGWDENNPYGLFETVAGEGLYVNATIAAPAGTVNVAYMLVP